MPQVVNFFWHGPRFRRLELACLQSFNRHGHRVVVHAYERPENLPAFAEHFDASRVMPRQLLAINRIRNSVALGADRYRYQLVEAGMGLYADCDVFCLAPIESRDYAMGWQASDAVVNNALLHFPPGSELSQYLLESTARTDFIPPWWPERSQRVLRMRRRLGLAKHVDVFPWGVWGPDLLSHAVKTLGLAEKVQMVDAYYPLAPSHFPLLVEPGLTLRDLVTPRSKAVHLWNSEFDRFEINRDGPAPPGSPLEEIFASLSG